MKLGGSGSLADDFPDKPKGMHWRTFNRQLARFQEAESRAIPPFLLRQFL